MRDKTDLIIYLYGYSYLFLCFSTEKRRKLDQNLMIGEINIIHNISKMKKILKCLSINLILGVLAACGTGKNVINNWQEKPLIATGIEKDWGETLMFDSKSKFWYRVSNDDHNLYIMLKMDDESLKRKVLVNGLKVFVDTTNHKKEKFGVHFPIKRNFTMEARDDLGERHSKPGDRNPDRMKERLLEELQTIELIGFNNRESDMLMIGESKIRPVVTLDQYNQIIYQLVLPLGCVCRKPGPKTLISIGFIAGNTERPSMERQGGGFEPHPGGGMRGGSGGFGGRRGGMERGAQEGGRRDMGDMSQPSAFWIKDYCLICKNSK